MAINPMCVCVCVDACLCMCVCEYVCMCAVLQCGVDLWTVAQSYVYFEKVILKVTFAYLCDIVEFCETADVTSERRVTCHKRDMILKVLTQSSLCCGSRNVKKHLTAQLEMTALVLIVICHQHTFLDPLSIYICLDRQTDRLQFK